MLYQTEGLNAGALERSLIAAVRAKLTDNPDVQVTRYQSFKKEAVLAVTDVRLCLKYGKLEASGGVRRKLVTSHMRVVFSIPRHGEYFQSGYPSEPIVALVRNSTCNYSSTQDSLIPLARRQASN